MTYRLIPPLEASRSGIPILTIVYKHPECVMSGFFNRIAKLVTIGSTKVRKQTLVQMVSNELLIL